MAPDEQTLREGRRRFFAAQGFAPDGGYDVSWATETFAGLPYSVPNTRARARALRVHDLHHVLTGYGADWRGEAEISAWELGSGGAGGYAYAWFIALFGLATGLLTMPTRIWAAFVRGRRWRNLYRDRLPSRHLDQPVLAVRRELATSRRGSGVGAFAAYAVAALTLGTLGLLLSPLLVLIAGLRGLRCPICRAWPSRA